MFIFILTALLTFSAHFAFAAEPPPPFQTEAEVGAIVVSGNSESENYAGKFKSTLTHEQNSYIGFGRYLDTTANGVQSAHYWDLGFRYERALTDYFSVFAGQKSESDIFAGYRQRDSSDIGLKYYLTKTDLQTWIVELGYRYTKNLPVTGSTTFDNYGRVFTSYNLAMDKTFSFKYWAEYLPNLTESDAYLANTEASVNMMINSTFSLKYAYLLQYQNVPATSSKYTTTTNTLNVVATF